MNTNSNIQTTNTPAAVAPSVDKATVAKIEAMHGKVVGAAKAALRGENKLACAICEALALGLSRDKVKDWLIEAGMAEGSCGTTISRAVVAVGTEYGLEVKTRKPRTAEEKADKAESKADKDEAPAIPDCPKDKPSSDEELARQVAMYAVKQYGAKAPTILRLALNLATLEIENEAAKANRRRELNATK